MENLKPIEIKTLTLVGIVLGAFLIGGAFGYVMTTSAVVEPAEQAGEDVELMKRKLAAAEEWFGQDANQEITGTFKSMSKGRLFLSEPNSYNPLVILDDSTSFDVSSAEIVTRTQMPREEYDALVEEYNQKVRELSESPEFDGVYPSSPEPYVYEPYTEEIPTDSSIIIQVKGAIVDGEPIVASKVIVHPATVFISELLPDDEIDLGEEPVAEDIIEEGDVAEVESVE